MTRKLDRCAQINNIFGFPLPKAGTDSPCRYHLREDVDILEQLDGRDCAKDKPGCYHHFPMDEFELWVYEARQKEVKL